jgi:hypothetical protein
MEFMVVVRVQLCRPFARSGRQSSMRIGKLALRRACTMRSVTPLSESRPHCTGCEHRHQDWCTT